MGTPYSPPPQSGHRYPHLIHHTQNWCGRNSSLVWYEPPHTHIILYSRISLHRSPITQQKSTGTEIAFVYCTLRFAHWKFDRCRKDRYREVLLYLHHLQLKRALFFPMSLLLNACTHKGRASGTFTCAKVWSMDLGPCGGLLAASLSPSFSQTREPAPVTTQNNTERI